MKLKIVYLKSLTNARVLRFESLQASEQFIRNRWLTRAHEKDRDRFFKKLYYGSQGFYFSPGENSFYRQVIFSSFRWGIR